MIQQWIGRKILALFGWKVIGDIPTVKKYIIIQAPHTSNIDFLVGKVYNFILKMKPIVLMKKELFVFPLNLLLRWLGGVPLIRTSAQGTTGQLIQLIKEKEKILVAITPEGSRKLNGKWKTGFYRIAQEAQVPIALGIIDYKKREVGIMKMYYTTGNMEEEMKEIKSYYKDATARHPELFSIDDNDVPKR